MIHTSKQLKDKVSNLSRGDSDKAKFLIRSFMMERFLERVSLSKYQGNFIIKGGVLVAAMVGVDMRATMDIDTTVKALPLNEQDASNIISEICKTYVEDGVSFKIISVRRIMDDFDYPGIRMMLEARLDRLRQSIKIDISTDDIITPSAVKYEYKLMFEERTISLLSYNLETLLAEKLQTILARGIANTRLRDFYDVYELISKYKKDIDTDIIRRAFAATCSKRETVFEKSEADEVLSIILTDAEMKSMWNRYKEKNYYVEDFSWEDTVEKVSEVIKYCFPR